MKDLYNENHKTVMKEIEEDTKQLKDIYCLQIGKINIVKMPILPKTIYRFSVISIKISMKLFLIFEKGCSFALCIGSCLRHSWSTNYVEENWLGAVAHTCNPSTLGGQGG